jgi:hypothetical protein
MSQGWTRKNYNREGEGTDNGDLKMLQLPRNRFAFSSFSQFFAERPTAGPMLHADEELRLSQMRKKTRSNSFNAFY